MIAESRRTRRRTRALAHQCRTCRRHWALRVVEHPAGRVVVCQYCSAVTATIPTPAPQLFAIG